MRRARPGREPPRVGKGSWVTWIVVLCSSKVLTRLSTWQVRWESPKLTEAGPGPTDTEAGEGRASLGKGLRDSTGFLDPAGSCWHLRRTL